MKALVTGGAGFIGSNFVHMLLSDSDHQVINLDALTYAGNPDNLADLAQHPNYHFVHGNILDRALVESLLSDCDAILHLAAESHVDRSISDSRPFLESNVLGTKTLLDAARTVWGCDSTHRLLQVSTDEVYGSLGATDPGFS